ncbi:helix-turn-helix domain-containing protein [Patescibacteria group bacterium]|nr:helix-turn-helix domain-containing protein [Patescibacteria group bacterium]
MFQASSILKNAREDRELSLEELSSRLKISKKYLKAIEENDIKNYPKEPYCSLYVKEYATFLGLNDKDILSFFRRDYQQSQNKTNSDRISHSKFFITPQKVFTFSVITITFFLFIYLITQYFSFNQPPKLSIDWPTEPTSAGKFHISGQTDPQATVRINDNLVIVDDNGNFSGEITLNNDDNKIIVLSVSPSGQSNKQEKFY